MIWLTGKKDNSMATMLNWTQWLGVYKERGKFRDLHEFISTMAENCILSPRDSNNVLNDTIFAIHQPGKCGALTKRQNFNLVPLWKVEMTTTLQARPGVSLISGC